MIEFSLLSIKWLCNGLWKKSPIKSVLRINKSNWNLITNQFNFSIKKDGFADDMRLWHVCVCECISIDANYTFESNIYVIMGKLVSFLNVLFDGDEYNSKWECACMDACVTSPTWTHDIPLTSRALIGSNRGHTRNYLFTYMICMCVKEQCVWLGMIVCMTCQTMAIHQPKSNARFVPVADRIYI